MRLSVIPLLLATLAAPPALAESEDATPEELRGITVEEKLGAQLPLDLKFTDGNDMTRPLSAFFGRGRPVIITLNYYGCPMLCGLQLDALIASLKQIDLDPADDYRILTVSFDPLEEPGLAKIARERYLADFARDGAARGWTFTVGQADQIKPLCEATGFRFRWNDEQREWAHPAVAIVCTPDGRISRYLGLGVDAKTLKLALLEAGEGRIGSLWDQVWLSCFQYSSHEGQYTPNVMAITRLAGMATVAALCVLFVGFELVRRRMAR